MKIKRPKQRYMRYSVYVFFLIFLISSVESRADVTTYECTEGLSMPSAVQWTKVLIDSEDAFDTEGAGIASAGDDSGNFFIAGSGWSNVYNMEFGLLVRMDQLGSVVNSATFFDFNQENGIFFINPIYNTSQTLEGYIAAGYKNILHKAPGEDNWWLEPDVWLMKLDLSLDEVWEKIFGMQGEDWANTVIQNEAGFLVGGALRDVGDLPQTGWLFQTDVNGDMIWSKSLYYYCSRSDEKDDILHDACPEPNISSGSDDGLYSIIYSLLPAEDVGSIAGYPGAIRKLDSDGNEVWLSEGDNSVIAAGSGFISVGVKTVDVDSPAIRLTKVTAGGSVEWSKLYGENTPAISEDWWVFFREHRLGWGVVEAADGGYIVAGETDLYGTGNTDLWLFKIRPGTEGELAWTLPLPGIHLHSTRPMMTADDGDIILVGSTDCDGAPHMLAIKVGVSGLQAPQAVFTMSPSGPYCINQEISFDASASSDPDGTTVICEWSFGDGTVATGPIDTHSYTQTGDYTIILKVTDGDGLQVTSEQTVTIGLPGVIWERTYANTEGCLDQSICDKGVRSYDIIKGVDGGFVISGRSNFQYTETSYDSWLLKTFDNGIRRWEKNLTNDPDVIEEGSGLAATLDDGYIITGVSYPYGGGSDTLQTMLIKTDSLGNTIWHRIYTDYSGAQSGIYRRSVLALNNGDYLVGGNRWEDGTTNPAMWLFRTDSDGLEIPGASRMYPPQDEDYTTAICCAIAPALPEEGEQGFVLTGYYGSEGNDAPLPVIKTDDAGDLTWSFHWPATTTKKLGYWIAAVDDGYVVAGQSGSNYGYAAVMKVNEQGSESQWVTKVPFTSHGRSCAIDGTLTPDGGIAIVGWIMEPTMYNASKIFLAKFNNEGACDWYQVFQDDAEYAYGTGVLALDDGSLLVLGDECHISGRNGCRTRLRKIGPNVGPVAAFDMDVREGTLPLEVQFTDLASSGTPPYTYAWDFDNDGNIDAMDQNPVHTYSSSGVYSVRLEVTDDDNRTNTFICEGCIEAIFSEEDTDGDGVPNAADNCPNNSNPEQEDNDGDNVGNVCDTCPEDPNNDIDADGVCGNIDNCPAISNPGQENIDGDSAGDACDTCPEDPDNDSDGDGVCGNIDNCPAVANPGQENIDGDSAGDACDACPEDPDNDSDGDGVCGNIDNCPAISNPGQENIDGDSAGDACDACPEDPDNDSDGDGVCGNIDNCPAVANSGQENIDGDGDGDACDDDIDGDGVLNTDEDCPTDPGKTEAGICGCGVADTDSDSDGTRDCIDNCPGEANSDQSDQDGDGIGDACDNTPSGIDTGDGGDGNGDGGDGDDGLCFVKGITP